ncbi:fungal-specific transcription factor domain-containing protein [Aspergillus pseudonomiae]|uniref:Fungal-specific transcription factor domain-containing protein n=1 Tax=Aspergillus pseudonomiae TaxID=1506151 RepID=A0A5N7DEV1_9EURO|nr:fungal-specific transcription factor domain-containing protein [Aspergillus pseudonomiae]KAE8404789.1 fungal-specific transcription factor domain-containing protein [Aspergillus pseudonomiae]
MEQTTRIRKRVPKSCRRCHRRKQRCVGFPICANCTAANEPCLRLETSPSWHHGMSKGALAQRIEALEAHLSAITEGLPSTSRGQPVGSPAGTPSAPEEQTEAEPSEKSRATAYFGPSSGVTLTENLSSIVEDAAWTNRSIPIHDTEHQEPPSPAPTAEQGKAVPPDDTVGRQLLDAYFVNMHTRLPFINCAEMLQLHSRRYDVPGAGQKEQYGMFKLFMIYAIGAAMPQLTEQYESTTPSAYYATAMQFDSALRESLSITGIEGRMLMIIYELRSSSSSNLWYTIGTAMRICIDLGMHRESHYRTMKPLEAQLHRRLFWSVYVIERHVSWSLGRPFSIAEDEIDAQIPADTDDLTSRYAGVEQDRGELSLGIADGANIPAIRRFIATVHLQRIMSRTHTKIYRVDKNVSTLIQELSPLLASLEQYKRGLPPLQPQDNDFIQMHWNNCVRALLQPFLSILDPEDDLIRTCLHVSGQMCQLFKRSQQKGLSGYSFLLSNSVYIAGLTMCFCLFRSPRLWRTNVANDLRACSSAMFAMAERKSSFRKYRDNLENMINRVMAFVDEASTSSLCIPEQSTAGVEGSSGLHFSNLENSKDPVASTLDLQSAAFIEAQEQEASLNARNSFASVSLEDFWADESLNLPTLDVFGFGWDNLYSDQ